jgi:membrane-associated protease RseP (regulator of RpoE activity)
MARSMSALLGGGQQAVHEKSGAFEIRGLGPGTYDVLVSIADGRVGKLAAIKVAAGERKEGLRVVVSKGSILRGKIVEYPQGTPLAGISVVLFDDQPLFRMSGEDGTFSIEGLVPGRKVRLALGGPPTSFVAEMREMTLPPGQPEVDAGTMKLVRGTMRIDPKQGDVGLRMEIKDDRPVIQKVAAKSPAAEAGLQAGQRITTIDGQAVEGVGENGVTYLLGGKAATSVQIGIGGPGAEGSHTVTLVRRSPPESKQEGSSLEKQ